MADIRITDLVDPQAIEDLRTVKAEVKEVREVYLEVVRTLAQQTLKIKVETVGDVEKLNTSVVEGAKKAEAATTQLNAVINQQKEIVGQTTAAISAELAEITKENKAKREAVSVDKEALEYARSIIGTREENVARMAKETLKLKELKAQQSDLDKKYKEGKITYADYISKKTALVDQIGKEEAAMKPLKQALRSQNDEMVQAAGSTKEASYQLEQMKLAYRQLTDEEQRSAPGVKLNEAIQDVDKSLKSADEELGDFHRNVGNYAIAAGDYVDVMLKAVGVNGKFGSSLAEISAMEGGNIFSGLTTKAKAFFGTLKGMLANPAVLAFLGIGGAVAAFKWWYDYNKGLMEATRLTREFLGITGDGLVELRSEIQAVADEYDKDYVEVLKAVDILTKQYGIDSREAMDIVRGGFQAGADLSGNMLSNMERYAPIFKDMKLDGSQLAAILAQTRNGIFNEQGLQMMQMATKRLREMSASTKKSLEEIGISTDEWNEKLVNGEANFFDYLQEISRRLGQLPQESNEVGNVLKDVFGRNGAAGGMELVKYFGDMTTSLDEVKKKTGEVGELHDQHVEKVKLLNKEVAALFDLTDEGFEEATLAGKNYMTDVLIKMVQYLHQVVDWFKSWYDESIIVRGVVNLIGLSFKQTMNIMTMFFKNTIDGSKTVAKSLRAAFDLKTLMSDGDKYMENLTNTFKEGGLKILDNAKTFANDYINTYKEAYDNVVNPGTRSSGGGASSENSGGSTTPTGIVGGGGGGGDTVGPSKSATAKNMADVRDIVLEATKKIIEDRLKLTEEGSVEEMTLKRQLAEAQMASDIASARKAYEKEKEELDKNLEEKKVSREEYAKALEIITEERASAELAAEKKKDDALKAAREAYATAEVERIAETISVEKSLRDEAYIEEVTSIKQRYASGLITRKEYEQALVEAKNQYEIETAKAVIESLEKQLAIEEMTDEQREKVARELAKAKADLSQKEVDIVIEANERQEKSDDELAKKRKQNLNQYLQVASQAIGKISKLMGTLYDGQMEKIEEQKEANQAHYDEEVERIESLAERGVITTEEAEARKVAAEKRRAEKEEELEKRKQEIAYKKALWEKATSVAQAGINTALGITAALRTANIALAAVVGAMGAIEIATILATPIKAYAKGTPKEGHPGGLAVVGDGGKRELVVFGNSAWLTPDKPTVIDLPKGAMVYPDADKWRSPVIGASSVHDEYKPNTVVVNDYRKLEKRVEETNRLMRISIMAQRNASYRDEFNQYRRNW